MFKLSTSSDETPHLITDAGECSEHSEATQSDYPAIIDICETLSNGQQPSLDTLPDELVPAFKKLTDYMAGRNESQLASVVEFSVRASESMASVANITGSVRHIESTSQVMASAIEELDASIGQMSQSASSASDQMNEAKSLAVEGVGQVREANQSAEKTLAAVEASIAEASEVNKAVGQISGFVSTIDNIAQQTNLLALNATIEAARAGEAGKGFAVVAGEVKSLSNQTQQATQDISSLIEKLQSVVSHMLTSVESANEMVVKTQEYTASTEENTLQVNDIVAETASNISAIAGTLSEQSKATNELSEGVSQIACSSQGASLQADHVIKSVGCSEEVIEEQFALLDQINIHDYVLHRAKSDHFLWKKKLSEMLVGLNSLTENELADHHSCRLGKWYDSVSDETILNHPAYGNLPHPHEEVHINGKKAARLFATGDSDGARSAIQDMETASDQVVAFLDELINR